ncbi:MAG: hypothetical protein IPH61_12395 [Bacteroidetes bacterium]|nr:hypothetical protein [Bacteroidota bacterium]
MNVAETHDVYNYFLNQDTCFDIEFNNVEKHKLYVPFKIDHWSIMIDYTWDIITDQKYYFRIDTSNNAKKDTMLAINYFKLKNKVESNYLSGYLEIDELKKATMENYKSIYPIEMIIHNKFIRINDYFFLETEFIAVYKHKNEKYLFRYLSTLINKSITKIFLAYKLNSDDELIAHNIFDDIIRNITFVECAK